MAYIENRFKVGQYALCINDNFPIVETTGDKSQIGINPITFPKKGEICCVDEILGEFLRFDEYDCNDETKLDYGWRWWIHTHFKPITQEEVEHHYAEIAKGVKVWFDGILA